MDSLKSPAANRSTLPPGASSASAHCPSNGTASVAASAFPPEALNGLTSPSLFGSEQRPAGRSFFWRECSYEVPQSEEPTP